MDEGLCKVYCIDCYDVLSMLEKDLVVPGDRLLYFLVYGLI